MRLLLTLSCSVALLGLGACGQADQPQASAAANEAAPAAAENGTETAAAPVAGSPQDVIKARQAHYKDIGKAMKAMSDEAKKDAPALAVFQDGAKVIGELAPQVPTWFPEGSGAEAGIKTAAKPEIWQKPDLFKEKATAFATAAATFQTVAASGDIAAIKAGVPELGKTCKGCHDEFRLKDD